MSDTPGLTVSADVLTAHLPGEAVLLDMDTKNYYRLNATAAEIWRAMEKGMARQEILDDLLARYEVDEATAAAEVDALLAALQDRRLVRPADAAED
jgi:hypothetical protein